MHSTGLQILGALPLKTSEGYSFKSEYHSQFVEVADYTINQ